MRIYDSQIGTERDATEAELEMFKDAINGPSIEELSSWLRIERQSLLAQSDWTQLNDVARNMAPEKLQAWEVYRQALRDITLQTSFPNEVVWPVNPDNQN
jgi:hypothetical protein